MARTPKARLAVLNALVDVLVESGAGAVTLDSVAARAGVTKNGLLYHFKSRLELFDGLCSYVDGLAQDSVRSMAADSRGPVHFYLVMSSDPDVEVNRGLTALTKLSSLDAPRAPTTVADTQRQWRSQLTENLEDPGLAAIVTLIGDGLWMNTTLTAKWPEHQGPATVAEVLTTLDLMGGAAKGAGGVP